MKVKHIDLVAPLSKAIEIAGGQSALARLCGSNVKQQHIYNWLNRDRYIPAEYVISIERGLNGAVSRHELRPDIYPPPDNNVTGED